MALSLRKQILFTAIAVSLVWLCAELLTLAGLWLRPWKDASECPLLYGPHPYRAFTQMVNRVDRARRRSFNSLGLRGREILLARPTDMIRIVCVGGSTTFSDGATTDSTTYPARMERFLRAHYQGAPFRIEVINAGVNCYNSLESLIQFETSLLDLLPDIVVSHHAINDIWFMLGIPGFQSDYRHGRHTLTVRSPMWWEYSPFLSLWFARDSLSNPYFPARFTDLNLLITVAGSRPTDSGEDRKRELTPEMVATFERNTRSFVSVARGNGVIPVLSTQSSPDDTPEGGYWHRAIERLNTVSRDVARSESVGLVDLAQLMPWNPVDYYDSCHLRDTPGGLGRQAEAFAQGLMAMRAIEQSWERRATARGNQNVR